MEGSKTYDEIARIIGIAESTLKKWVSGDQTAGTTAALFSEEYRKLKSTRDEEIEDRTKSLKLSLLKRLDSWVKNQRGDRLSKDNVKLVNDCIRALNSGSQKTSVDITQIYNTNLTGEDLVNEYKRLQSIADAAINRRAVSRLGEVPEGEVSLSPQAGNPNAKAKKNARLRADAKAKALPRKPGQDKGNLRRKQKRQDNRRRT